MLPVVACIVALTVILIVLAMPRGKRLLTEEEIALEAIRAQRAEQMFWMANKKNDEIIESISALFDSYPPSGGSPPAVAASPFAPTNPVEKENR